MTHQARCERPMLAGVDEIVLSLYAKGLTTGEMQAWQARPLDEDLKSLADHAHAIPAQ